MPILQPLTFDQNDASGVIVKNATQNVSAKDFFSPRLTGTGKKMGLLNERTDNPAELRKTQAAWKKKTRNTLTNAVINFGSHTLCDEPRNIKKKDSLEEGSGEAHFLPLDMTPYGIMQRILLRYNRNNVMTTGLVLKDSSKYGDVQQWHELWSNSQFEIRIRVIPLVCVIKNEITFNTQTNRNMTNTCPWFSYSVEYALRKKDSKADDILLLNSISGKSPMAGSEIEKYAWVMDHNDLAEIPKLPLNYINESLKKWLRDRKWAKADIDDELAKLKENHEEWYDEFSHSKALKNLASIQASLGDDIIITFIEDMINMAKANNVDPKDAVDAFGSWVRMIDSCQGYNSKRLLSNNLLNKMTDVFTANEQWFTTPGVYKIFNQSLRLLLAKRLKELNELKANGKLHQFTAKDQTIKQKYQTSKDWSNQQKAIIVSEDPLIIGAAGAGSGKSHTVIGRLSYLKEQGVDMTRVGVFSFTNIAADNIKARYKGIRSETLANMFNEIYQMNYPNQILSQASTLSHTLQMINLNHKALAKWTDKDELKRFIDKFSSDLENFDQQGYQRVNLQEAYRDLNELLRENLELVETLLNMAEQTTLDIEPAILHIYLQQGMQNIKIPDKYKELDFIITDESQDISTFEYIILLELAIHYQAQLLIVGDGSQTLYEFRNSDPRYINALEGSGVFQSKKLDVNFRSRQEILDFANQFLEVIEANDIAQIQLSSNQFSTPTKQSMEDAIVIRNMATTNRKADSYNNALESWFADDKRTQDWIMDKIDRGEQIAFLAWTRKEVEVMEKAIEKLLKKKGLSVATKQPDGTWTKGVRGVTLMAKKQNTYTLMSKLLLIAADRLKNVPTDVTNNRALKSLFKSVVPYRYTAGTTKKQNIEIAIENAIDRITREYDPFTKQYGGYQADYKAVLYDVEHGKLSKDQYVAYFKKRLIGDEITENSVRNYLKGSDTSMDEIKSTDPATKVDLIYSTIHSAKGLEFDNVVICHNNNKRSAHTQEALRLFFVGLSRAKKRELIINGEYNDPYGRSYTSTGRSGMLHDPINTAYHRCMTTIQMGVRPVSGKLEKDITEFGLLEDE